MGVGREEEMGRGRGGRVSSGREYWFKLKLPPAHALPGMVATLSKPRDRAGLAGGSHCACAAARSILIRVPGGAELEPWSYDSQWHHHFYNLWIFHSN